MLGQYEFPVTDPDAPGAAAVRRARTWPAPPARSKPTTRRSSRWVALHETTHALQFGGVPWLRAHMADRIRGLLASHRRRGRRPFKLLRLPRLDDLRALADAVRAGGLVDFVAGPERRALLDELQATMALLEGYAEHVMDADGRGAAPRTAPFAGRSGAPAHGSGPA